MARPGKCTYSDQKNPDSFQKERKVKKNAPEVPVRNKKG